MNAEEIKAKGRDILEKIAHIRKLRDEQERLFKQLEFHAALMLQGIDPEQIATWEYDPLKDKRRHEGFRHLNPGERLNAEHKARNVYNMVTLKDGSRVQLNPPIPRSNR